MLLIGVRVSVGRRLEVGPSRCGSEEAVWLPRAGLARVRHGKGRHLIHDDVRPDRGHRLANRRRSQPVHHDAQLLQQPALVVVAVTRWPRATSRRPSTPVPPATNTRMTITFPIPESVSET